MKIVCSGFRDEAHVAAQAAVLRRYDTFHDLYFSDGIGAHDVDLGESAVAAKQVGSGKAACVRAVCSSRHRGAAKPVHPETCAAGPGYESFSLCQPCSGIFDDG